MVSMAVGLLPLRIELFRSNEFYPARVLLSLRNMHLCRHSLNFAHVPVVDAGHLPIVPGNRDRIPTRLGDNAAISGIAPPTNTGALFEILGFIDCHCCSSRSLRSCAYYRKQRIVSFLLVLHCFTSACGQRRKFCGAGLLRTAIERCRWLLMSGYGWARWVGSRRVVMRTERLPPVGGHRGQPKFQRPLSRGTGEGTPCGTKQAYYAS